MPRKSSTIEESLKLKEKIINLFNQKPRPSLAAIGKKLGVSRAYVSAVLNAEGLNPNEDATVDMRDTIEQIKNLSGLSYGQIAKLIDARRESVQRWSGGKPVESDFARKLTKLLTKLKHATSRTTSNV